MPINRTINRRIASPPLPPPKENNKGQKTPPFKILFHSVGVIRRAIKVTTRFIRLVEIPGIVTPPLLFRLLPGMIEGAFN